LIVSRLSLPLETCFVAFQSEYVHHKVVHASMGIKIAANNLDTAIAGGNLLVCGKDDDIEDLKVCGPIFIHLFFRFHQFAHPLQHGALQTARIQQAVVEQILSQLAQKEQQVRYALSGNRGSWHERNRFPEILCIKQNIKVTEGMLK